MSKMSNPKQEADIGTTDAANAVDIDALMKANIARVFNERDSDRRRVALGELYTAGATLYDPETAATGREAISRAIDNLLLHLPPNFVFTAAGHAVGHNGAARLFWRAGPPNGSVAITGTDVAHIEDGRIKCLYVFVDPVAR
jgi:SnoaL-like domain